MQSGVQTARNCEPNFFTFLEAPHSLFNLGPSSTSPSRHVQFRKSSAALGWLGKRMLKVMELGEHLTSATP